MTALWARDEFISVAAHELTRHIISLKGQAQLQIYRPDGQFDATRLERGLRVIDRQSERLAQLITRLLDASQVAAAYLALYLEPADLAVLVAGVVEAHAPGPGAPWPLRRRAQWWPASTRFASHYSAEPGKRRYNEVWCTGRRGR